MAKISRSELTEHTAPASNAGSQTSTTAAAENSSESSAAAAHGPTTIYDIFEGRASLPTQEEDDMRHFSAPSEPENTPEPPQSDKKRRAPASGGLLLLLQAALSGFAVYQLYRTQMFPMIYLAGFSAILFLAWLLAFRCRRMPIRGFLTRALSVVLCAALAVGCLFAQQGMDALQLITSGAVFADAETRQIVQKPFVVYLSGIDTRGALTEKARSDVNILAVIHPVSKRVVLINTPRDYYVPLAGTDSYDKLTHAGLYGVAASMDTLGNFYGMDVDHYVRINFAGFMGVVDALGGVDVYSDYTFTSVGSPGYYNPTDFTEGWNHLDGPAALAFSRERKAFASGDIQRGINQMKVIEAMLQKLKSPTVLLKYTRLISAISDCFITSLSSDQIAALVRMQLSDLAEWKVESYTVTGSNGSSTKCYSAKGQKLYVMLPDEASVSKAKGMVESVLSGENAEDIS